MKPRRAPDQPAFVLHARPYREHHWLVELLTPDQGRLRAVARDPRPETFRRLRIRLSGQTELKRLDDWQYVEPFRLGQGAALLQAFYLNELCVRLVPPFQAGDTFFGVYASSLLSLADPARQNPTLRFFERRLLEWVGAGIDYRQTLDSGDWIVADHDYRFDPALGFCARGNGRQIPGQAILAMAENDWMNPLAQRWGEAVHGARLDHLLEGRALLSRQWLKAAQAGTGADKRQA
ncbi:recombination protein O N-terminal domain-containing protein [Saccharospirillum sp. HFRX-1]|uniref:DNA repair protein RecO n=1 Tax=unclassified Saccharospirillum TaxID=2633430 RepID=UPI003723DD79